MASRLPDSIKRKAQAIPKKDHFKKENLPQSEFANIDSLGNLNCVLCKIIVKNETVWGIHLRSKNHKERLSNEIYLENNAKRIKEESETTKMEDEDPMLDMDDKKTLDLVEEEFVQEIDMEEKKLENERLPDGFFDEKPQLKGKKDKKKRELSKALKNFNQEIEDLEINNVNEEDLEEKEYFLSQLEEEINEQKKCLERTVKIEKLQKLIMRSENRSKTSNENIFVEEMNSESEEDEFVDWRSKNI